MLAALVAAISPAGGCAAQRPEASVVTTPAETPSAAAQRLLRDVVIERARGDASSYNASATAGEPQGFLVNYQPHGIPAPWVVENDLHVPAGQIFAAMRPSVQSTVGYLVPILQDGRPVSWFDLVTRDGRWDVGRQLAEPKPWGFYYDVDRGESALRRSLGASAQTRVALFLPSGLVFLVGHNGAREAAVFLGYFNHGPGLRGFDKDLPEVGTMYDPADLQALLTP